MDIEKKIKDIIVENLGVKPEEVKLETGFKDLSVDSLDKVELAMALEEAFNIEIPDEDAEKLLTVKEVVDYTKGKIEDKSKA